MGMNEEMVGEKGVRGGPLAFKAMVSALLAVDFFLGPGFVARGR